MTHSLPHVHVEADRASSVASPEHAWISYGSTLNPSPGRLLKERRDTAEGCRDRATADLLQALTMNTANGRQVLEKSAASWTMRAEILQRIESGTEARDRAPELTSLEIAEDAAFARSKRQPIGPCIGPKHSRATLQTDARQTGEC
jgi:hypothetical protein